MSYVQPSEIFAVPSAVSPRRSRAAKTASSSPRSAMASEVPPAAPHTVEVLETYFDAGGKPIKRKSLGAARVARSYDEHGNQVEEAYFSTHGKPTPRKGLGAARIHWRYDENGKKVEAEFFGADGALLSRQNEEARVPALQEA
jgi:hypothetical protein